jgi:hypothetical protein
MVYFIGDMVEQIPDSIRMRVGAGMQGNLN